MDSRQMRENDRTTCCKRHRRKKDVLNLSVLKWDDDNHTRKMTTLLDHCHFAWESVGIFPFISLSLSLPSLYRLETATGGTTQGRVKCQRNRSVNSLRCCMFERSERSSIVLVACKHFYRSSIVDESCWYSDKLSSGTIGRSRASAVPDYESALFSFRQNYESSFRIAVAALPALPALPRILHLIFCLDFEKERD